MYIDLIVLIILLILVFFYFKRFDSFVLFVGIVEIFLRILSFVKNHIGLSDVKSLLNRYFPDNIFSIIDRYSKGSVNLILKWIFVIFMCIFLSYVIKIFIRKKKI